VEGSEDGRPGEGACRVSRVPCRGCRPVSRCLYVLKQGDQERQSARALRTGMPKGEVETIMPLCQKCMTVILRHYRAGTPYLHLLGGRRRPTRTRWRDGCAVVELGGPVPPECLPHSPGGPASS
jgi:hypothetical protein